MGDTKENSKSEASTVPPFARECDPFTPDERSGRLDVHVRRNGVHQLPFAPAGARRLLTGKDEIANVKLASPLRLKSADFELDHEVAVQAHVVEKQVHVEGLSVDLDWHMAADEGETPSELQEKVAEVSQKSTVDLPLVSSLPDREEIEIVRIFEDLLGEVGVCRRQGPLKIYERLPSPLVKAAFDLKHQNVSAPAMLQCHAEIPRTAFRIVLTIQEHHVVTQGDSAAVCCTICSSG